MKNSIHPRGGLNGQPQFASPIAIRIVKMLCPASPDSLIAEEALKVDAVIQMPAILQSLEIMKQKVAHEQKLQAAVLAKVQSLQVQLDAATLTMSTEDRTGMAALADKLTETTNRAGVLLALIEQLDDYVIYLHDAEKKYVLPEFLKRDDPTIYPKEVVERGTMIRRQIGALIPAWLKEHLDKRNEKKDTVGPAVKLVRPEATK